MSQNESSRPVACTLTEEQRAKRSADIRELLRAHYLGYDEAEDGLAVRFEGAEEAPEAVAQFVAEEWQCCSFADYEITVAPPYEETVLTITGPEGTREMFREGLVDRLETGDLPTTGSA